MPSTAATQHSAPARRALFPTFPTNSIIPPSSTKSIEIDLNLTVARAGAAGGSAADVDYPFGASASRMLRPCGFRRGAEEPVEFERRLPPMSASAASSTTTPAQAGAADAAEAAVEAIASAAGAEATFSLALTQDQKDVRDWVHGFAADVVRAAAHEWDEKEQTPWPIIQEAAKIGLYGFEGIAQFFADPTGLTLPIVNEELFWGDAGIGMSIMGTSLAVAAIFGQGSGEQIGEWIPRCFGTPDDVKVAAFCASEPNAGSDISGVRTTAKFDEAAGEWVLNGQKAWATNGGIADVHVVIASVDRELGSRGHAAFVVPMSEAKGLAQGP